ncbi:MAG: SCO family protein [Rhodospirillales bacterium]|jgi:protein SCO1|nr:SCO family protein [Rhodospirillales bacterium]
MSAFVLILGIPSYSYSHGEKPLDFDERKSLALSEASVGREIGRYSFVDSNNKVIQLDSFLGKPLIISLIYTSCKDVCPMVSDSISDAVDSANDVFGEDSYNVITIGFDDRNDTPTRMNDYKSSHGLTNENWTFLSADHATIDRFAENSGFLFYNSPKGFDHMTRTTLVDSAGLIYRHVYGETFDPPLLMEPLKDLLFGRKGNATSIDGIVNQIRLFCTIYDPNSGRYRFDMSIFIAGSAGLMSMGLTGFLLVRMLIAYRRQSRKSKGQS